MRILRSIISFPLKGCGIPGSHAERKARGVRKGTEAGKNKTKTCQADWSIRWACRRNRSYQDPAYVTTMATLDRKAMR